MTPAENAGNLPALFASARPATKLRLLWYVLGYGLRRLGLPPLYRGGVFEFRFGRFEVRTGRGDLGTIGEIYINHTYDLAGFQPRPGDVCLDIGANIGCVAVQWYSQDATGRIIAVEPHPITAAQLRRNLDLNGAAEVEVIQAAAGRECGEVTLIVDAGAGSMGRTLGADVRNLSPWESERAVRVPSITVDSIVKSHALGRIDLL
ncbi:MAG: FkbM family methyltransferase, partial [Gemmatimonadetes bacterium]|nr:FkbM family methyltransferase [Gemmatimonadota bacterium]